MHALTTPARARAQLIASDVHLARGGRPVLAGVSLTITPGARWGVVGENGRGKSTLLHVLAGVLTPDAGSVRRVGTLGSVEQEMAAGEGQTVGDVIAAHLADARSALTALDASATALAHGRDAAAEEYEAALEAAEAHQAWDADRRVAVALDALGAVADHDRPLTAMSVGQRYRVRLACLLGAAYDFLLLDEPTNHLDQAGLDYLTGRLTQWDGAVVVVSHDRALLRDVTTTIIDLDPSADGTPSRYGNGYDGYVSGRRAARQRWEEEYAKEQTEHARLAQDLAAAQQRLVSGWRPDKGTGKHQRATRAAGLVRSVRRREDVLTRHPVSLPEPPLTLAAPSLPARAGVALVRADEVTVAGRLGTPVTVTLESGARLVVSGPNGAGKSTVLAVLARRRTPDTGHLQHARRARIALLGQESEPPSRLPARVAYDTHIAALVCAGLLDVEDTVELAELGLLAHRDMDRPVRELSMGQQRRLDLALALAARPHLLLLDEPTNHLSIALVDELTEALEATAAAVVVATHDRQLRRDVAHWSHLALPPTWHLLNDQKRREVNM
ncbi:ATP-binding cassette domain-containing protein [Streptomyces zagrosensis]|uniref:Macrolide transport system ATP-binding/permease protein n=1 Tax=Streptomyces zagrosensis TaxID=1042984 RepID=A0A7W9Q9Q8_9ACTN|nr:ATP-binding cassette domain-containing protein [Streptomyces zagrosensis]MBB5936156.1 macrolide transport system ATP-binding/permease protein [Streptomyces zagrosensis]